MFARALSNFRSTSSLDVGGDKDGDGDAPAVAQEAPAATEAVQAPTATAPAKSSASAKKAAKAPIKAAPRPAATKKAPTTVAQRPAPAKASKAGAGASRSNWFRGPTKKAAKAPAETDLEAPPAPAQPAPTGDLEAQTSAAPAPAPSPAPPRSSWFPSRAGAKTDIEAGRAQTAGGPAAPVFVVSGKSGARLRAGVELDSSRVADLPSGTCVTVRERATTRDGAERCCVISGDTIGWLSAKLLISATPPAVVRSIFDGVDGSENGTITVLQAWKALRTNDAFAWAMGFDGRDDEWDRLVLAFDELKEAGKKNMSFDEFQRVALSAGDAEADDGPAAAAAGTQSSAMSKLRAAIHASTAFRATDAPPPPPESSGGPPDLPPPAPSSSPGWFDTNF